MDYGLIYTYPTSVLQLSVNNQYLICFKVILNSLFIDKTEAKAIY